MRGEQAGRLPGWLRATLGTAGDVVLFAALSLAIWTVLPAVALGATPVVISGGSMSPLIRAGDVVLLDDTPPPEGEMFAPGTVLTFEPTDAAGTPTGGLLTHRVSSVQDGHYLTRGDANAGDDPRPIHPNQVVGAGRWFIPLIGLPAHWARGGDWHLVVRTALGGVAAVAASMAGRRRVVVDVPGEVTEDLPLDQPETTPAEELVPVAAEPVLAFHLEPEPSAPAEAPGDGEVLDPAAAERAATVAAQAARRSAAGLDRVREEQEQQERTRRSRRRDRRDGSAGSAPVASILALALAVVGSTIAPTFAAAAYVATTSNTGNTFTVATAPDPGGDYEVIVNAQPGDAWSYCATVDIVTTSTTPIVWSAEIALDAGMLLGAPYDVWNATWSFEDQTLFATGAGYNVTTVAGSPASFGFCADRPPLAFELYDLGSGPVVPGSYNQTGLTYSWSFVTDRPAVLHSTAVADLLLTPRPGAADRAADVSVVIGGHVPSLTGGGAVPGPAGQPAIHSYPLTPATWTTIPVGTPVTVEIRLQRADLIVNGPSVITFPQ